MYQDKLQQFEQLCPPDTRYKSHIVFDGRVDIFELEADCEESNRANSCAISRCTTEGEYILNAMNLIGTGDGSPLDYQYFSTNGFSTMETCAGLDFGNMHDVKLSSDRTIRPNDEEFGDFCVVNSMLEYNQGDHLRFVPCDSRLAGVSNRMRYLWKYSVVKIEF